MLAVRRHSGSRRSFERNMVSAVADNSAPRALKERENRAVRNARRHPLINLEPRSSYGCRRPLAIALFP